MTDAELREYDDGRVAWEVDTDRPHCDGRPSVSITVGKASLKALSAGAPGKWVVNCQFHRSESADVLDIGRLMAAAATAAAKAMVP